LDAVESSLARANSGDGWKVMKITRIETFLVDAKPKQAGGWEARNWLFVKVHTDEGIYGVGEASGWPRVVQTAIEDLTQLLIGEDPTHIDRLWQKMMCSIMGHGMTGVVGFGAMTGIEMALWDLKGKAMGVPVWNLLGGKIRDKIRVYAHAHDAERARELVDRGYTAIKTGGIRNCVESVRDSEGSRAGCGSDGGCPRTSLDDHARRDRTGTQVAAV